MSGFDWGILGKAADELGDRAFGPKKEPLARAPASVVESSAAPSPTADQELAAANQVAAQTSVPVETPAAPAPMPQTAPAPAPSMQPLQTTVSQNVVSPKAIAAAEKADAKYEAAVQSKADADIAANTAVAEEQRARAAIAQQHADETASINAQRAEMAKQKADDVAAAAQEYDQKRTIDPDRYMKNAGTGGRILAAIAQGLGAFGAAITHSPNYAAELIDKAINADIKAQEHDVATLGHKVQLAQNDYANFRNQGLDDDAARTATYQAKMMAANSKIDALLAENKNPQLQAAANEMKAINAQRAAANLAEYTKRQVSSVSAAPQQGTENQIRLRNLEVVVPQKDPKTGKELPPKTFLAKSSQDAEKIRDSLVVQNSLQTDLTELKNMVNKTSQSISPVAKAKAEAKYKQIKTKLGVLYGLGALAAADLDIVSQLGDPTSLFQRDSTTVKLIDQLSTSLQGNVEAQLAGRGVGQ